MKPRAFLCVGILVAISAAASAQVRVALKDGRRVIYNERPSNIAASEERLAGRVGRASAYDDLIAAAARDNAVDPKLVKSVMLIESAFDPAAISRKGARGLMQLTPAVAAEHGVVDVHDPKQNITAGTRQLSRLMSYYAGDLVKSLAAYNAGESAVDRYDGVPPYVETQLYVRKTLAAYYGKSTLGGGFGKAVARTYGGIAVAEGRSVQWVRDTRTNRVTLTTKGRPAPRRLG